MEINYTNKTVFITGATRGIGSAMADAFEDSGAKLILTGTNKETIKKLNEEYSNSNREYFCLDFTNSQDLRNLRESLSKIEKIDVLVNNAGINILDEFVISKDEDFDKLVNVNIKGPYLLGKIISEKMIINEYGRILNICSIWSKITRPKRALYTMTKNALHGLTQTMAVELSKHNILVNSLSPGFTLTDLTKKTNTQAELNALSEKIPIGRMAMPSEIAKVALFLASEQNSYLTGQNIVVDGGFTNV
jgi:3-oxoacyl-[acyl-carrier protein] reductase